MPSDPAIGEAGATFGSAGASVAGSGAGEADDCGGNAAGSPVAAAGESPGALQDANASIAIAIVAHASFRIIACLSKVRASLMFRGSSAVPSYRAG